MLFSAVIIILFLYLFRVSVSCFCFLFRFSIRDTIKSKRDTKESERRAGCCRFPETIGDLPPSSLRSVIRSVESCYLIGSVFATTHLSACTCEKHLFWDDGVSTQCASTGDSSHDDII